MDETRGETRLAVNGGPWKLSAGARGHIVLYSLLCTFLKMSATKMLTKEKESTCMVQCRVKSTALALAGCLG